MSSTTFRPMRSWTWARRMERRSVLLIITRDRWLGYGAMSWKNLSARVALKFLNLMLPNLG